jgi:hypothetical protein
MASGATNKRRRTAEIAVLLCLLIAGLAVAVAPAAAEEGNSAPIRPLSEGGLGFGTITAPTAPEEYPLQYDHLSPELRLRQVSEQLIVAEYFEYGVQAFTIGAVAAHDVDGAKVPSSIRLSEDEEGPVITLIVSHRAGNPAAGGVPFAYPILSGEGWEGGYQVHGFEMNGPLTIPVEPTVPAAPASMTCMVPALRGLSLKGAKARLRAAHCAIGDVHLGAGATAGKSKVVKQFRAAGTEIPSGAPVAVKLGSAR